MLYKFYSISYCIYVLILYIFLGVLTHYQSTPGGGLHPAFPRGMTCGTRFLSLQAVRSIHKNTMKNHIP